MREERDEFQGHGDVFDLRLASTPMREWLAGRIVRFQLKGPTDSAVLLSGISFYLWRQVYLRYSELNNGVKNGTAGGTKALGNCEAVNDKKGWF